MNHMLFSFIQIGTKSYSKSIGNQMKLDKKNQSQAYPQSTNSGPNPGSGDYWKLPT